MSDEVKKKTIEEQLLQSRGAGLKDAIQINTMNAHGKVMGMDTFSWVNPQIDALASALESFPFTILWVGSKKQVEDCLKNYKSLTDSIDTIIIHDFAEMMVGENVFENIQNIACVEGLKHALPMIYALKKEKCAFLFTTEGANSKAEKKNFYSFIELYK
tara:strand:- start:916 stop:1392 length:477 start_codon:yes stop_codon:yes gene_type:complete